MLDGGILDGGMVNGAYRWYESFNLVAFSSARASGSPSLVVCGNDVARIDPKVPTLFDLFGRHVENV